MFLCKIDLALRLRLARGVMTAAVVSGPLVLPKVLARLFISAKSGLSGVIAYDGFVAVALARFWTIARHHEVRCYRVAVAASPACWPLCLTA